MSLILLVDDDIAYRSFLVALLEGDGCAIIEARDGAEALEILRPREGVPAPRPDLIVSDFNMPRMGGFEFIRAVRRLETGRIPIIMISSTEKDIRGLVEQEDVVFLRKLATNAEILAAVRSRLPASTQPSRESEAAPPEEPSAPSGEEGVKGLMRLTAAMAYAAPPDDAASRAPAEESEPASQMVQLVDGMLSVAVSGRASDIHIEPQKEFLCVRLRIDGVLQTILKLPVAYQSNIAGRLKVMANLNVAEKRLPQDGRFSLMSAEGRQVEFRLSTLPAQFGEKIVMRILRHEKVTAEVPELFPRARDLKEVETALKSPTGLILLTGPTGSGKTTTLYTMLDVLNEPTRNIITVEDPVENEVPGITQVPVRAAIGYTFERVLRACLRQDPNVLMVGEIRDLETAEIAMKAAMTGHLVLSTLHTNTAPSAVDRLAAMGLKPYMIAGSLKLVIAQRLLRLLCPFCKVKAEPTGEQAAQLRPEERGLLTEVYGPKGCERCGGIGYKGRRAVMEVMSLRSHEMRRLVVESAAPDAILACAMTDGMVTLRRGALELAAAGLTSLDEAFTIYYVD